MNNKQNISKFFQFHHQSEVSLFQIIINNFLIFSKNHKTFGEVPVIFIEMIKEWVTTSHMNGPPSKVRYIGSDDKIVDITNKY